jgi:hypothetical protein
VSRLITLVFVTLLCQRAAAEVNTQSMVLTLQVPDGREPEFVCVVTQKSCVRGADCVSKPLIDFYNAVVDASVPDALPTDVAEDVFPFLTKSDALKALGEGDIHDAAEVVANRTYRKECDAENRDACRAKIRLKQFRRDPATNNANPTPTVGRISCVRQRAARGPNPASAVERVAFISLRVGADPRAAPAVSELHLYGSTLSVDFDKSVRSSTSASAEVIGGDYAFKDAGTATVQHLAVPLIPRCGHTVVALPPHSTRVASITIDKQECVSPRDSSTWNTSSRRLELEIPTTLEIPKTLEVPATPTDSVRKLEIRYEFEENASDCARSNLSEAEWTDAIPPKLVTPGQRVIRFSWTRPTDCLRDEWKDDVPATPQSWNGMCPQATLASNTKCALVYPHPKDDDRCDYVCTVPADRDPLQLPAEVRFDRFRLRRTQSVNKESGQIESKETNEIVYSWKDQVSTLGEQLSSVVPTEDRRLFIELDPSSWKPRYGDQYDAIRVIVGQAQEQIDLTGDLSGNLHSWFAMSTPGRTCSDRTRLAIFGTRKYKETTRSLNTSQLRLGEPATFRDKWQGYIIAGGGVMYRDFPLTGTPVGHIGIGAQFDLSWFAAKYGALSINFDIASLELSRQFYKGIELPYGTRSEYLSVPYLRVDLAHVGLEWWRWKRFGFGFIGGVGVGTPVYFEDDRRVGDVRGSVSWRVYGLYTMSRRRLWLMFGTGLRHFEEHADFGTDFLGEPTRELTHPKQWQFFIHFRWMMP